MMHLAYPTATKESGFFGCVRYLSLPHTPEKYDEEGSGHNPHLYYSEERYPQSPNVEDIYRGARELVQRWDKRSAGTTVYKICDQATMNRRGPSLDLAFLLALIRRARFCILEELEEDIGDAWCTGTLSRHNGKVELDSVDRHVFVLKLQGFIEALRDRLFFVPLFNMDPPELKILCQNHLVDILDLQTFQQRFSIALQQGQWSGRAVITIANHELALLAETLFRSQAQLKNPFRPFNAFQVDDAESFGGRKTESEILLAHVRTSRSVALIGLSGSGKSSLVFAGVVPNLDAQHWLSAECLLQLDRFGALTQGLKLLRAPLLDTEQPENDSDSVTPAPIAQGRQSLAAHVDTLLKAAPEKRLLLIVDQFEELFNPNITEDQRRAFREDLHQLVHGTLPCCVLLTMRVDFLPAVLSPKEQPLSELFTEHVTGHKLMVLDPISGQALEDAIRQPARVAGLTFEETLVTRIVVELWQEPGNLTISQVALTKLFEQREGTTLTYQAYKAMGGVRDAVAQYADAMMVDLAREMKRPQAHLYFTRL